MNTHLAVTAMLLAGAMPGAAHRLDEYLQRTMVTLEKDRLTAQMTLTPDVAVAPELITEIDWDADDVISEAEQRAYALRVLGDLSIDIDGKALSPQLSSVKFPSADDLLTGRGEIQLEFQADLPPGRANRKLVIENRHESKISAYQVKCLVPRDPKLRIVTQKRNASQSLYELDYSQPGQSGLISALWPAASGRLGGGLVVMLAWVALLWKQRG